MLRASICVLLTAMMVATHPGSASASLRDDGAVAPAEAAPVDSPDADEPTEEAKPDEAETPTEDAKPADAETPTEDAKPADADTPTDTEAPTEESKPDESEPPAEDANTDVADESASGAVTPDTTPASTTPAVTTPSGDVEGTAVDGPRFVPSFGRRERVIFGVVGGVLTLAGAGLVGVSVSAMLQGRQARDDLDAMLADDPTVLIPADEAELDTRLQMRAELIDDGHRSNRIAIGTGVSGGILFGTGVALVILGLRKPSKTQLSPSVGRRTAGFVLRGRF